MKRIITKGATGPSAAHPRLARNAVSTRSAGAGSRGAGIPFELAGGRFGSTCGVCHAHLIGVAGTGLRCIAAILTQKGVIVSGSENVASPALDALEELGVRCHVGHREENVSDETELVIVSAAIREDNPEMQRARELDIPVVKYAEFVGGLMRDRAGIAVSGTHGKTTTTAMVTQVLFDLGAEPGFVVGGEYPAIGGSSSWGTGEYFVAEACEFDRSFLKLSPTYAIVTNVEEDHLDYFESLGEIQSAFSEFIETLAGDGFLVLNADDSNSAGLADRCPCRVGSFSLTPGRGDWWADDIRPFRGGMRFVATSAATGARVACNLRVPGIHNVKNALAVLTLLAALGFPPEEIGASLARFRGVKRRFEVLLSGPVTVVDDYAHHPTEIEMVLRAARETYPGQRLRVVFQPHQYSRTFRFLNGFAEILAEADEVMIPDVFAARDSAEDMKRIDARALVRAVLEQGGVARYRESFDAIVDSARRTALPGDVFLCLGAGDITLLASRLASELGSAVGGVA